jgi:hypothetical protein
MAATFGLDPSKLAILGPRVPEEPPSSGQPPPACARREGRAPAEDHGASSRLRSKVNGAKFPWSLGLM